MSLKSKAHKMLQRLYRGTLDNQHKVEQRREIEKRNGAVCEQLEPRLMMSGTVLMEHGDLAGVSNAWQTVQLDNTYTSMVVVATPSYDSGMAPAVTRIQNATGNSFEIMVQNPSGADLSGYGVSYMVVEEGVYTEAANGINMEAVKYTSTVTDENGSWVGQQQAYQQTYTAPVVLGQVMTYNDANWSTFWSSDGSTDNAASATSIYTGKQVAEDTNVVRADETVGYIVMGSGSGVVNGESYSVALGIDTVCGVDDAGSYTYGISGLYQANSAVLSMSAMDGVNGGWAALTSAVSDSGINLVIDEDQIGDTERNHTSEQVAYIAFGTAAPTPVSPKLATGTLTDVGSTWQTVTLSETYDSMVVTATPSYSSGMSPAVTRIRNASGNSFEVMVQNPGGEVLTGYTVQYMVVEEGVYNQAEHGIQMEAFKYDSSVTDRKNSWAGQQQGYQQAYNAPVVFGQVMTYNDANWSTFWCSNGSQSGTPSTTTLFTGKHVGEDSVTTRSNETVGYIVMNAGSGTVGTLNYTAGLGADTVSGVGNSAPFTYTVSGVAEADTAILSQNAMDGGDGSWAVLYGDTPISATQLNVAVDEDVISDTERAHTTEQLAYIIFDSFEPAAIFVDSNATGTGDGNSWANAYTDLQSAINSAAAGDEIWVADGVYTPTERLLSYDARSATFSMKTGVEIYGGFQGGEASKEDRVAGYDTILSGDLGVVGVTSDNAYSVVYSNAITGAVLDGVTVTGGYADGATWKGMWAFSGAGMTNEGSTLTVSNVLFTNNGAGGASGSGGGMANWTNANITLIDTDFDNNTATFTGGGISNAMIAGLTMTGGTVSNNTASGGGGMYNWHIAGTVVVDDVDFIDNTSTGGSDETDSGGGVMNDECTDISFINVDFIGNDALGDDGGGMMNYMSSPTITGGSFVNNTALNFGGGLINYMYSDAIVTGVLFDGNTASYGGGVQNHDRCAPVFDNVIFSNNIANSSGGGMTNDKNSTPTITNSQFNGNAANGGEYGQGGGLYNRMDSHAVLNNVSFTSNTASRGGGMYSKLGSNTQLTDVTFTSNTASIVGGGMVNDGSTATLFGTVSFLNNISVNGGGVALSVDSLLLGDEPVFSGNTPDDIWIGAVAPV